MARDDFYGSTKECMNIIFLLDTSGSMCIEYDGVSGLQQLNNAMPAALAELDKVAMEEEAEVIIRIIKYGSEANWHMGTSAEEGLPVEDALVNWIDLPLDGSTNTAAAIRLALDALHTKYLGTRNYHPVVILITDGCSDSRAEMTAAVQQLKAALAGNTGKEKVQRISIGVKGAFRDELVEFASVGTINHADGTTDEDVPLVFEVDDISKLTSVLKCAVVSSLYSVTGGGEDSGLVIDEDFED